MPQEGSNNDTNENATDQPEPFTVLVATGNGSLGNNANLHLLNYTLPLQDHTLLLLQLKYLVQSGILTSL